ncbi:hypothetical protein CALCODRAFT_558745 [Calocera cornea HHB12733]|uniref:F-box domain-containing protein n=1 Tax=Calocera cornea HHB12733 TaxID=1353952 RepID=A0A165CQ47_9BASI|nr:hypothetical protein CALCODRAFT_558745 [Calocera cornea HHB12733]
MRLTTLPAELLEHVLAELDLASLAACHQVCKRLHATITHSTLLQYRTALSLHALSPTSSALPTRERLTRLLAHAARWRALLPDPAYSALLPLPQNTGSTYELYGSLFVRGLALPRPHTTTQSRTDALHVLHLPSALSQRGTREWLWRADGRDCAWSDFTLSPAADLVVLVEKRPPLHTAPRFRIHLLTLSSGRPHPAAKHPILTHTCRDDRPQQHQQQPGRSTAYSYLMQVCGGTLACLFLPSERTPQHLRGDVSEELVLWDWRTGQLRAVYSGEPDPLQDSGGRRPVDRGEAPKTFCLLAEDALVLAGTDTGALEVCTLPPLGAAAAAPAAPTASAPTSGPARTDTTPATATFAAFPPSPSPSDPHHGVGTDPPRPTLTKKARFLLPALRPSTARILSVLTRSDPSPAEGPFGYRRERGDAGGEGEGEGDEDEGADAGAGSAADGPELFYPSPSARLLALSLTLDTPPDTADELMVFVLLPTLLEPLRHPTRFAQQQPGPHQPGPHTPFSAGPTRDAKGVLVFPWPAWSARARVTDRLHSPPGYVCYVHGYRYVTGVPFVPPHLHAQAQLAAAAAHAGGGAVGGLEDLVWTRVTVWDFNPVMARRVAWEQRTALEERGGGPAAPAAGVARTAQRRRGAAAGEEHGDDGDGDGDEEEGQGIDVVQGALFPEPTWGGELALGFEGAWEDLSDSDSGSGSEEEEDGDEDGGDGDGEQEDGEGGGGGDEDEDEDGWEGFANLQDAVFPADDEIEQFDSGDEDDMPALAPFTPAAPLAPLPNAGAAPPAPPRQPAEERLSLRPATLRTQDVFVAPVESGLAAVARQMDVPGLYTGLFVDGERIIGLLERGGREYLRVDVF